MRCGLGFWGNSSSSNSSFRGIHSSDYLASRGIPFSTVVRSRPADCLLGIGSICFWKKVRSTFLCHFLASVSWLLVNTTKKAVSDNEIFFRCFEESIQLYLCIQLVVISLVSLTCKHGRIYRLGHLWAGAWCQWWFIGRSNSALKCIFLVDELTNCLSALKLKATPESG